LFLSAAFWSYGHKRKQNIRLKTIRDTRDYKERATGGSDIQRTNLGEMVERLLAQLLASPSLCDLGSAIVVVLLDGSLESGELLHIGLVHVDESKASCSLLVNNLTKAGLALNNAVWDTHATAESRQPNNQLNRLNIVSDDDQLGLLLLNKGSNVVETILNDIAGASVDGLSSLLFGSGSLAQTELLGLSVFGAVLVQKLEQVASYIM
tara:strand:- start:1635 stop:2258 length:624 start_codon:yes stop_codon:yes gene_type:complete